MRSLFFVVLGLSCCIAIAKKRARELNLPLDGTPGPYNAITDVAGIEVGHVTLISGSGKLEMGKGPVRTGVTAILPRGKNDAKSVFAASEYLNGNGDLTGTQWVDDSGLLDTPILFTNTYSLGTVRDGLVQWLRKKKRTETVLSLPVIGETWDGFLNDIAGLHVKASDAVKALESAKSGIVEEGNVGGGTGMICFEFKCGIGTSSRVIDIKGKKYTVGVLVQANFGLRSQLKIAGVKMVPYFPSDLVWTKETGSILVLIATDAPLIPNQLKRMARRAGLGIGRLGGIGGNGSGDLFLAISTANAAVGKYDKNDLTQIKMLNNEMMDAFFEASIQATEESILNALMAGEEMIGVDNHKAIALSQPKLVEILKKHNLLLSSE